MAIHATARSQWAQARLLGWLKGLSLTGTPAVFAAIEPGRSAQASPSVRVGFEELPPLPMGRFSATQTAMRMSLLVICDLFWPHPDNVAPVDLALYQHLTVSDELREAMQFLELSFLDYTAPAAPVAVAGTIIRIQRAQTQRIPVDKQADHLRVRTKAVAEWIGRFDDHFA